FLPPCVGRQADFQLGRLLRLVDRISLAAEEASTCTSESAEGAVPTVEGARGPPGTVAPPWCYAVCHRAGSRWTLPAGFGPPASLRGPSWRARCITKGARRVRKGAPGNLPARSGKAPGAHLTRPASRAGTSSTRG